MKKLIIGKKKLLGLGLALVMTAGMLLPANVQADETPGRIDVDGVETSKTVIYDEETKEYTLRLESYVTGAKTEVSVEKAVPTDFVLAIDVSGSMHRAIDCGCTNGDLNDDRVHDQSRHPVYADAITADGEYYLDTNRTPLYYCDECANWYDVEHVDAHEGTLYIPKTSEDDADETHKQFYLSCRSRLEAAKEAVDEFLYSVKENSKGKDGVAGTEDDVAHRVAIVAFGGPNKTTDVKNSQATGLYTYGGAESKVLYHDPENGKTLEEKHYKDSLRDVTVASDWNILAGVSGQLFITEGTRTDQATDMINKILKNNAVEGRNRVAVLFTDGVPRSENKNYYCADDALKNAVEFKTGEYATPLYVVGCFDAADASKITPWEEGNDPNKFMHLVSSNYLNATELSLAYTSDDVNSEGTNYYQTVASTDEILNALKTIFENTTQGGADILLDDKAVLRDTISAEYVVDGDREAVAYVKAYTGKDAAGNDTWGADDYSLNLVPEVNGQVVDVTGFDFAANYVGFDKDLAGVETARGKKVVVEIPINPAEANHGGNFQATNEMSESGIYYPDSTGELIIVEQFDLPHVDIPTTVTVKKIVDEETPDIEQEFAFSATGESVVFKAYEGNDQTSGNHLEATAMDMAVGFVMGHGDEFVIENLLVGSTITVKEENIPKYYGLVSVFVNGEELEPDQNGDYTFEVTVDTEVVFTNKIVEIDLSGNKTWDDEDDKYGVRPESITINLLADGEKVDSVEVTAEDDWAWSFNEVPKYNEDGREIAYTVTEEAVVGYTTETSGMDVTNTLERIEVTGSKTWDDEDNKYGVRPESITINLLADGEKVDSVEVTAEDDWAWTFDNLPKYNSDKKEVVYTVTEKSVAGYTTELNGLDVTNTLERTEVTGSKTWVDEDDKYGVRPESITINLLADGEKVDSVEVTAEDDWAWTFDNLPKYNSDKKEVVYTITEESVAGYETKVEGYDVTNTLERTKVAGSKTWEDENDKDGIRPESITINLLADGEKVDSVKVTEKDKWAWTFDNLPKYNSDKKEVVYTLTEDEVKGYTTRIEGYDVKNTHVPKVAVQPDTNDHSTTGMYILMMCMAVVAMAGIVVYRRKR